MYVGVSPEIGRSAQKILQVLEDNKSVLRLGNGWHNIFFEIIMVEPPWAEPSKWSDRCMLYPAKKCLVFGVQWISEISAMSICFSMNRLSSSGSWCLRPFSFQRKILREFTFACLFNIFKNLFMTVVRSWINEFITNFNSEKNEENCEVKLLLSWVFDIFEL